MECQRYIKIFEITMTTEDKEDNRKSDDPPPPINIEQGRYILRKGYFHCREGEGQTLADRYQAFKIHHLERQSLYIHWLIIDIISFKCLSLHCLSIAVISVK
jgi:hypothetical protein